MTLIRLRCAVARPPGRPLTASGCACTFGRCVASRNLCLAHYVSRVCITGRRGRKAHPHLTLNRWWLVRITMRAVKIDHKPGQTGRGIDCSAKEKFRFAAIGKSICSSNDRDDGDQEMSKTKTILSDLSKQPRDASDQDEVGGWWRFSRVDASSSIFLSLNSS